MLLNFLDDVERKRVPWYRAGGAPAPVAAYQAKGAASIAASYVNLVTPGTYNAAPGVAPAWASATGWTFDALTQYLTTGVTPAAGWSMIIGFSGALSMIRTLAGEVNATTGASARMAISASSGGGGVLYSNGGQLTVAPTLLSGTLAVAGQQGYRNGVADGGAIAAFSGIPIEIYIGARHREAPANVDQFTDATIAALVIYSVTLTAPQVAAVSAAIAAL